MLKTKSKAIIYYTKINHIKVTRDGKRDFKTEVKGSLADLFHITNYVITH